MRNGYFLMKGDLFVMQTKEVWKPLIYGDLDLSNRIEVSNTGKLRNINTKKIYATTVHKSGYEILCISLGKRNRKKLKKG